MNAARGNDLVAVAGLTLRRAAGPRPAIRTDQSDMLVLTLPEDASDKQARDLVLRHCGTVSRWLASGEAVNAWEPPAKELVAGEGFPLGGRSHRMCWRRPDAPDSAAFEPTGHGVWLKIDPALKGHPGDAVTAIIDCYRRETAGVVRRRYDQFADRFGFGPLASVAATDDGARWVSLRAVAGGLAVNAHWALAQFGIGSVDYLLCRALCKRAKRDLEVVFPGPYARRRMQGEARDVWTGVMADRRRTVR